MSIHHKGDDMRAAKGHKPLGFTLIELMLVVAISLTLASIAGPELRRMVVVSRERAGLATVRESFVRARSLARSLIIPVTVSTTPSSIVIDSALTDAQTIPLPSGIHHVSIQTVPETLVFNAKGGLNDTSAVSIAVVTSTGIQKTFRVMPAIGAIREE